MSMFTEDDWQNLADVYAFIGNSLLKPMTQTAAVGLDPEFWEAFPSFEDAKVCVALATCKAYALAACAKGEQQALTDVAVEYTRLFVGPPSPAAPPWETMYRAGGASVGFGEATFQMRQLLRERGLRLSNENNQYEDHMGIELLYLSELCRTQDAPAVQSFAVAHPSSWIDVFAAKVTESFPQGYYAALLVLVRALLNLALASGDIDEGACDARN